MEKLKTISSYALIAVLLFPFLVLLGRMALHWQQVESPFNDEFFKVCALSLTQSLLSAALAVAIGVVGATGLVGLHHRLQGGWPRRAADFFLLMPSLFPALYIIVATLSLGSMWTNQFPFGIRAVILAHTLANFGLVTVVVARLLETKMGGVIEIATIEGAGKAQIIVQCLRGLRGELTSLFIFIFVLCFTSFSIPLVLGAQSGATVEVLIYRSVVKNGSLGQAVTLGIFETLLVLGFSWILKAEFSQDRREPRFIRRIFIPHHLYAVLFLSGALVVCSFRGFFDGFSVLMASGPLQARLPDFFYGTLAQSGGVALITGLLVIFVGLLAVIAGRRKLDLFLAGYIAPSLVVTGFAIYLLVPLETLSVGMRIAIIAIGFSLLMLPSIYRLRGRSVYRSLTGQIDSARIEGAGSWRIFCAIVWPQRAREIFWLCGLAAFWASGDFAFASLLAGRDLTLAMNAQSLLSGYRTELAGVLTWLALAVGAVMFFLCQFVGSRIERAYAR